MLRSFIAAVLGLLARLGLMEETPENKWYGLDHGPCYRIENLGRPAVFYLPAQKLTVRLPRTETNSDSVEKIIEDFLSSRYGGFTQSLRGQFGVWRDGRGIIHYDECAMYEVSFVGKGRIRELATFLSVIAGQLGEKCIYLKAGQYSGLLWPIDE